MTHAQMKRLGNCSLMTQTAVTNRTQTIEDVERHSLDLFQTDAAVTVISALSATVTALATNVANLVEFSYRSEKRQQYQILRDYTTSTDALTAVASIRKAVTRQNESINDIISLLDRKAKSILGDGADAGIDFLSRVDVSDDEFARDYAAIKKQLTDMLRPVKCSDPQMLYHLVYSMYMARRFESVARYVRTLSSSFQPGAEFYPMLHLHVLDPLQRLANHLHLTDKQGHELVFLFNKADIAEWERTTAKKHWQKKHALNPPVVVNLYDIFSCDSVVRMSWSLETHMFELKTIDRLITASEGNDPHYRHDYRFKRVQSCASSYEQAMLNQAIYCKRWEEYPVRMRQYVDSVNARHSIDARRRPKPVVCFRLVPLRDKAGKLIYTSDGTPDYEPHFRGIWNSAYEAEIETDIPWQKIRKSVELKAVNDGTNHIWLSLDDYISMTYFSLLETHPDVAAEFKRLLPEFSMRTTRQIAADTKVKQGTFAEAAI